VAITSNSIADNENEFAMEIFFLQKIYSYKCNVINLFNIIYLMKIAIIGAENIGYITSVIAKSIGSFRPFEGQLKQLKQLKLIDENYHKLRQLVDDKDNLVGKGIKYFKKRYEESPFDNPGINIYINLLVDCAKIGMKINEIYETSIVIIDYELIKLNEAYVNGEYYKECYDFDHPILKVYTNEFQKFGLSAAKAGEALAKLCKTIENLPKEPKSKYKSWQNPYKYHR